MHNKPDMFSSEPIQPFPEKQQAKNIFLLKIIAQQFSCLYSGSGNILNTLRFLCIVFMPNIIIIIIIIITTTTIITIITTTTRPSMGVAQCFLGKPRYHDGPEDVTEVNNFFLMIILDFDDKEAEEVANLF